MKNFLSIILATIMLLSTLSCLTTSVSAVYDSFATAKVMSNGVECQGTISTNDGKDYYKITLSSSSKIQISFTGYINGYVYIRLYDENYNQLSSKNPYANSGGVIAQTYTYDLTKGTYYIAIQEDNYTGNYTLKYTAASANESFVEINGGSDNSFLKANAISADNNYIGQIAYNDSSDYYKITLSSSSEIQISFTGYINGYVYIRLYDENYNQLSSKNPYANSGGVIAQTYTYDLTKGTYYIAIQEDNYTGNYTLKYTAASANETFVETNGGSNNTFAEADIINIGKAYKGQLAINDTTDYYKLVLSSQSNLTVSLSADNKSYIYMRLYDENFSQINSQNPSKGQCVVEYTLESGTYYIQVQKDNNYGNYTLKVQKSIATPSVTAISNTLTGVRISWNKISGADGYYVYRKTGSGSWSRIATINSSSTVSYVDKTVKSGTTYRYTVRAFSGNSVSDYTSGLSIKFLSTPKLASIANATGKVTVKWNKVSGATGYIVYRKTYNASTKTWSGWSRLATTKSSSYNDTKAKSGTYYRYTVRAYSGDYTSYFDTTGLKTRYLATPTLKSVASAKSGVTVKWGKVTGATGYIVYRKTGNGSWKQMAVVKGNSKVSYLDKTAKKGTTYKYTVRAYYGSYRSYFNTKGLTIKDKY